MEISSDEAVRSSSEDFVDARKVRSFLEEARALPAVIGVTLVPTLVNDNVPTLVNDNAPTLVIDNVPTLINNYVPTLFNDNVSTLINDDPTLMTISQLLTMTVFFFKIMFNFCQQHCPHPQ